MKTTIAEFTRSYDIDYMYNNIALVKDNKKKRVVDVKTGQIIFDYDPKATIEHGHDRLFYKSKSVDESSRTKIIYSIYDAAKRKMLCDNFTLVKIFKDGARVRVLQDPNTKKYHIFNSNLYKGLNKRFEYEWDDYKCLGRQGDTHYYSLSRDGKKYFYSEKDAEISSKGYDDIKYEGITLIFKDGNKSYFIVKYCDSWNKFVSSIYEEIKILDENIIIGKNGNSIDVYWVTVHNTKKLFTIKAEDIEVVSNQIMSIRDHTQLYYFRVRNNNGLALFKCLVNASYKSQDTCTKVTPYKYTSITPENGQFVLKSNEQTDYYMKPYGQATLVKAEYYGSKEVFDGYQLYYKDPKHKLCDIKELATKKTVVSNCKVLKKYNEDGSPRKYLTFEKNGKVGILSTFRKQESSRPLTSRFGPTEPSVIIGGYDKAVYMGGGYYLVTKAGKNGIVADSREIIPPVYKKISYKYNKGNSAFHCADEVYFILEKEDGTYEYKKHNTYTATNDKPIIENIDTSNMKSIYFFDYIIVYRTSEATIITTYSGKTIKILPSDTKVEPRIIKHSNNNNEEAYYINGVYYLKRNNSLEEKPVRPEYCAVFESDYGYVVVNEENYDEFCYIVDQMNDYDEQQFDLDLIMIYGKNKKLQRKYPNLLNKHES